MKRVIAFFIFIFLFIFSPEISWANFKDISSTHRYYNPISELVRLDILHGYSDGTVRPDQPINRAEFLKLLIATKGISSSSLITSNCFKDVPETIWYSHYVCYAKNQNWISGYGDQAFHPSQSVNRVEAIKMLVLGRGYPLQSQNIDLPYRDVDETSWYAPYLFTAFKKGVLGEAGLFLPSQALTRGEASQLIYLAFLRDIPDHDGNEGQDQDNGTQDPDPGENEGDENDSAESENGGQQDDGDSTQNYDENEEETPSTGSFNYAEALQKSIYFYEAQRSGNLPSDSRVEWRGDSAMTDGQDHNIDLTGGWYDAGDHVKFGFPMAASSTLLSWGALEFEEGYQSSGQWDELLSTIKWSTDYFMKAHTGKTEFWGQVGSGGLDHGWWGPAEVMTMERASYKIDANCPGSDLAGETSAALAAASIVFTNEDRDYSDRLLDHAIELYAFGESYRGKYSDCIKDAAGFYNSSGYLDELAWGATWLYYATGYQEYLTKAEDYAQQMNTGYQWTHVWDDKSYGTNVLLHHLTKKSRYSDAVNRWLDYWTSGYNGQRIRYTPGGLAWLDTWGSLRYSANTAFLSLIYSDQISDAQRRTRYYDFAVDQINYMLGDNPSSRSYVVGLGNNPPTRPHHRTSHGSWNNDISTPTDQRHILYGALVGGPDQNDYYNDDRTNYISNEVAVDYNAGFTGALAGLVKEFGGSPLKNFPEAETRDEEIFVDPTFTTSSRSFMAKLILKNHSAWPARASDDLSFRYFFDLSELFNAGYTLSDLQVTSYYNEGGLISALKQWAGSIYYVEVDFTGTRLSPGSSSTSQKEVQLNFSIPSTAPESALNPRNDFSYQGRSFIPVYDNDALVFGEEP